MATKTVRKNSSKTSVGKGVVLPFKPDPEAAESSTSTEAVKAKRSYSRRSPVQVLEDLKAQRETFVSKMSARIAVIDAKIERIEARSAKQLAVAELAQVDADELAQRLEDAKQQQRLLRLALKTK